VGDRLPTAFCFPALDAVCRSHTTPRQTEHNTELIVYYGWHPWAGQIVQFVATVDRRPELHLRVDRVVGSKSKRMDIPAWMFDRTVCAAMVRLDGTPCVPFLALCSLKDLISSTLSELKQLEQEHSPSLTQGNAHGKKKETPSRPRTAKPVRGTIATPNSSRPASSNTKAGNRSGRSDSC
jgi:hypothetical protein